MPLYYFYLTLILAYINLMILSPHGFINKFILKITTLLIYILRFIRLSYNNLSILRNFLIQMKVNIIVLLLNIHWDGKLVPFILQFIIINLFYKVYFNKFILLNFIKLFNKTNKFKIKIY